METVAVRDIPEDFTKGSYRIIVDGDEYRVSRFQSNVMLDRLDTKSHIGEVYPVEGGWTSDGAPVDASLEDAIMRFLTR
ncbi:hypothetical protein [Demequina sp. NBRC 110053]|uniref:hypothetical protein n=1 Tax=Demequina sp. NBRC 110053 TaxID=1570342 RepID=UPI001185C368|nr:hypothetical protein [Demequina sp. NBRC 110053]